MKNCATIVTLSLCCLCFCTPVFSSETSSFTDNSRVRIQEIKKAPLMPGSLQEIPPEAVTWHLPFGNTSTGWVAVEAVIPAAATSVKRAILHSFVPNSPLRLLKNYLLHLFPSHYFW